MLVILSESPTISFAKNIRKNKTGKLRFECVLQTVGTVNRNKRRYSKGVINEGLEAISDRIREGSLLGELDHPIDKNPVRQVTVLYKESSHRILDYGWDGNKLIGVVEILSNRNGRDLRALIEDGVPIGFSFRGMGELKMVNESGESFYDVIGPENGRKPIQIITWDAVNSPSHIEARLLRRINEDEDDNNALALDESSLSMLVDYYRRKSNFSISNDCLRKGILCTPDGICYLLK